MNSTVIHRKPAIESDRQRFQDHAIQLLPKFKNEIERSMLAAFDPRDRAPITVGWQPRERLRWMVPDGEITPGQPVKLKPRKRRK